MHLLGTALLRHRIRLRVHREYGCDGVNCTGHSVGGGWGKSEIKIESGNLDKKIYTHFCCISALVLFDCAFFNPGVQHTLVVLLTILLPTYSIFASVGINPVNNA